MATVFSIIFIISSQILEILCSDLPIRWSSLGLCGDSLRLPQVSTLAGASSGHQQINPHLRCSPLVNNVPVWGVDWGNRNSLASRCGSSLFLMGDPQPARKSLTSWERIVNILRIFSYTVADRGRTCCLETPKRSHTESFSEPDLKIQDQAMPRGAYICQVCKL